MSKGGTYRRLTIVRLMILIALVYWLSVSGLLLILYGHELDADTVFPMVGRHSGVTVSRDATPSNPPPSVLAALGIVGLVVGIPAVWPAKTFVAVLRISSVAIGACLVVTITRLGIVLAPVLMLQLLAFYRGGMTSPQPACNEAHYCR